MTLAGTMHESMYVCACVRTSTSTRMFDHRRYQFAILHHGLELFRHRFLTKHPFLFALDWQADVEAAGLGCDDLSVHARFAQIHLTSVGGVDGNGWDFASDLHLKAWRVGHA